MEENKLRTSLRQRILIIAVAIILLGSTLIGYAMIVWFGGRNDNETTEVSEEKIKEYEDDYVAKVSEFGSTTAGDYVKFSQYISEIGVYDEAQANEGGVKKRDLAVGDGKELVEGETNYLAYYAGWCADGEVFDASFDDNANPKAFAKVLDASIGMIDGWNEGVVGMRLGGIREITVPGEKAYGDQMEICGGYNKPLRFMVMAVANEEPLKSAAKELDAAYMRLQYAYYGIDYDKLTGQN